MQTLSTKTNRAPRRWFFVAGLISLITMGLILTALSSHLAPLTRHWVIEALRERYDSDIEIGRFKVSFFPRIRATGEEILFRHKGRTDVPPLISIKRLSADIGFLGLLTVPKRARTVRLEGLQIRVPPRRDRGTPERHTGKHNKPLPSFEVDKIIAEGTYLEILPKKEGKQPLTFNISRLTLHRWEWTEP